MSKIVSLVVDGVTRAMAIAPEGAKVEIREHRLLKKHVPFALPKGNMGMGMQLFLAWAKVLGVLPKYAKQYEHRTPCVVWESKEHIIHTFYGMKVLAHACDWCDGVTASRFAYRQYQLDNGEWVLEQREKKQALPF